MTEQKVSIILPIYNGEKTLPQCLASLLNQTCSNYEIIAIDNHSTDRTKKIILDFQNKSNKIKYIYENYRSRGAARNRGVKNASGEIIATTDSDCLVPANWLDNLIQPIIKGKTQIIQGNEEDLIKNYWTKLHQQFNQQFIIARQQGQYINHLDTKNFAIKKDLLVSLGMFNENIKNLEDLELKIRLKKAGYQIYFLENLRVKHFHQNTLWKLIKRRFDQGQWATIIYFIHRDYLKKSPDEVVKSTQWLYFFAFFPWLIFYFFKNNLSEFIFELVTGIAWRAGIVYGLFRNKNI